MPTQKHTIIATTPPVYSGACSALKVWGPIKLPSEYPMFTMAKVTAFLVWPAVLACGSEMKTT